MWHRLKNIYHGLVALTAALYFRFPGNSLTVVGVTGTDGKTTTAHLIHHILRTAGKKVSLVSSVYAEIAGEKHDTGFHVTTPDPWRLQKFLRQAVDHGDELMVLEVTSHGLDQNRVLCIPFAAAVITNVTNEHLDYHKNYVNYLKTKEMLLRRAKVAVVNKDDESFAHFAALIQRSAVTYGIKNQADITPRNFPFTTSLQGEYNRYNCLAAIAVTRELGIKNDSIKKALKTFSGVKGRFERVDTGRAFAVIIDFAHTPNAIENVLQTLRPTVDGRLIHVFGSAGLRDHSKRLVMGQKSAKYADLIVLTEEDFRTEDVNEIIAQIAAGCIKAGAQELTTDRYKRALTAKTAVFFRIPDRQTAINFAIQNLAQPGDTLILTGKAHETSLCRGRREYPWSEHEAVAKALKGRKDR